MYNHPINIYFIEPSLLNFVKHWSSNEKKLAAVFLKQEVSRYKSQTYFDFSDLLQDCLLAILENYRKKGIKFKFFHVQLLGRQTLSNLFKKNSTKILWLCKDEVHMDNDASNYSEDKEIIENFLILAQNSMSKQEYELFELTYIKQYTQIKVKEMLGISNHIFRRINSTMKEKIDKVLLNIKEK